MTDETRRPHKRHLSDELLLQLVQEVSAGTEAVPDLFPPDVLEHLLAGESNAVDRPYLEQLTRENPGLAELVSDLLSVTEYVDDDMPAVRLPILVAAAPAETEHEVNFEMQWNAAVAELANYPKWPRLPHRRNITGAFALAASLLLLLGFGVGTQWRDSAPRIVESQPHRPGIVFYIDPSIEVVCDGERISSVNGLRSVSYRKPADVMVAYRKGQELIHRERVTVTGENTLVLSMNLDGESVRAAEWDVIYRDEVLDLTSLGTGSAEVRALEFIEGDRLFATGGQFEKKGGIRLVEFGKYKQLLDIDEADMVTSIAVQKDRVAWAVANRGVVQVRRLVDNRTVQPQEVAVEGVARVTLSPDGVWLAAATEAGNVYRWRLDDLQKREVLLQVSDGPDPPRWHCCSYSPAGRWLIVGGGRYSPWGGSKDYGDVRVIDAETGETKFKLEQHKGTVLSVSVSPDGTTLATASVDGTIKLWSLETGQLNRSISAHNNVVEEVVFSPDGQLIASGGWDNTVRLWNSTTGELVATMKRHKYFVQSLAFSNDGSWLAAGGADGTVRFWNLVQRREKMVMQRIRKHDIKQFQHTRFANRRLYFEQLEARRLLAVEAARMEFLHQRFCDPEADNARITAVDTAEVASQTRHFSLVAYDTGHPAGSTFESDAVFGEGDCRAVPTGSGENPKSIRVWRFPEHNLDVEAFTVPNSLVEPMQVQVNGEVVTAGRVALARYVTANDVRQYTTWTADSYIRVTTLPEAIVSGNLIDDDFGVSAGIGPLTEFITEFGEKRLLGQIRKSTITPGTLPTVNLEFSTGSAKLKFATISQEVTRIDITANYPDQRRVILIGANPFTEDYRQTRDVLSDLNGAIFETVGPNGRLYVGPAVDLAVSVPILENVARFSLLQTVKSKHNPRDASFVVLLGKDIPTDGFGDVALSEAEDGIFDSESQKRGRAHASGNGEFGHETIFLNGESLSGTITVDQAGEAIPFLRHSLDNAVGSVASFTVADAKLNVQLSPTSDETPTIAGAGWNVFKNDFLESIVTTGESTEYSIGPALAEIDTMGLISIGATLGAGMLDVNGDGFVVAGDSLIVINFINEFGPMVAELGARRDTNRDGNISPIDVLLIINHIISNPTGEGEAAYAIFPAGRISVVWTLATRRLPELVNSSIAIDQVYAAADAHFADQGSTSMLVAEASEMEESLLDQLAIDVAAMLAG